LAEALAIINRLDDHATSVIARVATFLRGNAIEEIAFSVQNVAIGRRNHDSEGAESKGGGWTSTSGSLAGHTF